MRILFVSASVDFSIGDVSRGYRGAFERAGHDVADYIMAARYNYHMKAIPMEMHHDQQLVAKMASECILNEAMYHKADLVVIISGLNVHPIALWLLGQVGIPVAVVLTESPYDDEYQAEWLDMTKVDSRVDCTVFTNDAHSAFERGWHLLPPAFDPQYHRTEHVTPDPDTACDVLIVGTGWPERQAFLEAVNWEGIDLRIYGVWPGLIDNPSSPLHKHFHPMLVDNTIIASIYASAKVNINFHRNSKVAITPGPRVFELAACGAFQVSDSRSGLVEMFGDSVPTFVTPGELEDLIRHYLPLESERRKLAGFACKRVRNETFDHRVADMMTVIQEKEKTSAINSR